MFKFEKKETMLNAIPDTRNADDMNEVFLAPNEQVDSEVKDEIGTEEKLPTHETVDMNDRRKSSISSSRSTSSISTEIPQRNSTVDMGKFLFNENNELTLFILLNSSTSNIRRYSYE